MQKSYEKLQYTRNIVKNIPYILEESRYKYLILYTPITQHKKNHHEQSILIKNLAILTNSEGRFTFASNRFCSGAKNQIYIIMIKKQFLPCKFMKNNPNAKAFQKKRTRRIAMSTIFAYICPIKT